MDIDNIQKFLAILIANAAKWGDEGWGGYIEPGAITTQASGIVLMTPKLSLDEATTSMKPVLDFATSLTGLNIPMNAQVTTANSYYSAYQQFLVPNEEVIYFLCLFWYATYLLL